MAEDIGEYLVVREDELVDALGLGEFVDAEFNFSEDGTENRHVEDEAESTGNAAAGSEEAEGGGEVFGAEGGREAVGSEGGGEAVRVGAEKVPGGLQDSESGEDSEGDSSMRKQKVRRRGIAEKPKATNQRLLRSLTSINEKAKKLSDEPGVTIFFKGRYSGISQGGRKANAARFVVGSNFDLETGAPILPGIVEPIASINTVRAAIEDLLTPQAQQQATRVEVVPQETPTTSQNLFPSPFRPQSRTAESDCEKGVCQFHFLDQTAAAWVGCDFKSANNKCPYWVHAACLGFPEATPSTVGLMNRFFCSEHLHIVGPTMLPTTEAVVPPPKRGRGSRGGRGARRNLGAILDSQAN